MTYVLGYPLTLECALRYARDHRIHITPGKERDSYHKVAKRISNSAGLYDILAMVCWVRGRCELVYALHIDYHAKTAREARTRLQHSDLPPLENITRLMRSLYLDEDPKWWRYEDNVCPMPGDPDYTEEDNDYWCDEYQEALEAQLEPLIYGVEYVDEDGKIIVYEQYEEGVEYADDTVFIYDDGTPYDGALEQQGDGKENPEHDGGVECAVGGLADDGAPSLPLDAGLVEDDSHDGDDGSTERGEDEQDIAARVLVVQEEELYAEKGIQVDFSSDLGSEPDVAKISADLHNSIIDSAHP